MDKKNKFFIIIFGTFILIIILTKISVYLNNYGIEPIEHHSLSDVASCSEKVLLSAKMYNEPINVKCNCKIVRETTYYKYTCDCNTYKKSDNTLLQSGGSRILYEEKNTYKLKYNIWIKENDWYTGYCNQLK